jgi:hypothetical protein
MSPVRSIAAIVGGILLLRVLDLILPSIVTHTVASLLSGYVIGRIARAQEIRHAIAAAAVVTAAYVVGVRSDDPALPPMSIRIALLAITGPAIVLGAWIRARARRIQGESGVAMEKEQT